MDLTIVIPLFNEEESLPELSAWIEKVMQANNYSYEVIMNDDGSTDRPPFSGRRKSFARASSSATTR